MAAETTDTSADAKRDDGGPDGITCRDETIRLQDEMIERLRAAQEKK